MIAVCIATYNNEAYIARAIESVLCQKCDESVRVYIGDDASTDGTQAVCERFVATDARIVYIRRKQNMGLVSNTIDLYRRILADGAEYIAMLDGDDYWTDSHKLQLQILFRAELLQKADLDELEQQDFPVLDYPLYGIFSQYTKFGYLGVRTAVWRVHSSVSNPQSLKGQLQYKRERLRMWYWLDKKYSGRFHFRWFKAILWYIRQIFYILFA